MKIKKSDHESTLKALLAFVIILIASGIYMLFNTYQESIIDSGSLQTFLLLTILGMGLLVAVMFLANKPQKSAKKRR